MRLHLAEGIGATGRAPRAGPLNGVWRTAWAFTLIEMLATTALAALLMLAMLSVIASVGRTEAAIKRRDARHAWPASLKETIRRDLAQARTLDVAADQFRLTGPCALDPTTLEATHRIVEVIYSLRPVGDRVWLVRTQTPLGGAGTPWSAFVAPDVAAVVLVPLRNPLADEEGDDQAGRKNDVPGQLRLRIRSRVANVPDLDETILLRR